MINNPARNTYKKSTTMRIRLDDDVYKTIYENVKRAKERGEKVSLTRHINNMLREGIKKL